MEKCETDYFPDKLLFSEAGYEHDSLLIRMEADFHFHSSQGVVRVPKNFVSNGASIPRIFWNLLSPFGPYFKASICHDFGYSSLNDTFTRSQVDLYFLEGMKILGVGFFKRQTIYNAVKMFGWTCYKGYKA